VTVGNNPATVNADNTFVGYASGVTASSTGSGNSIQINATYAANKVNTVNSQVTVTGNTAHTLTYDDDGNLLSDGTRTLTWENGQLATITIGTHLTKFFYDGLGHRIRVQEWDSGVNTSDLAFIWCGAELCEERLAGIGGSASVNKQFFPHGQRDAYYSHNYYFTRDHLGSVREVLDSSG